MQSLEVLEQFSYEKHLSAFLSLQECQAPLLAKKFINADFLQLILLKAMWTLEPIVSKAILSYSLTVA